MPSEEGENKNLNLSLKLLKEKCVRGQVVALYNFNEVKESGVEIDFELYQGHVENVCFVYIIRHRTAYDVVRDEAAHQTRGKFEKCT